MFNWHRRLVCPAQWGKRLRLCWQTETHSRVTTCSTGHNFPRNRKWEYQHLFLGKLPLNHFTDNSLGEKKSHISEFLCRTECMTVLHLFACSPGPALCVSWLDTEIKGRKRDKLESVWKLMLTVSGLITGSNAHTLFCLLSFPIFKPLNCCCS